MSPLSLTKPNHVSPFSYQIMSPLSLTKPKSCLPFLLPNQIMSPLYSVKVFDILQRKERAVIHIRS